MDDQVAKFIVVRPEDELKSPELFVSNNPDDGYDLTFQSLAEFEAWRQQEEETHTVEFVRGDSHGSRSSPPRFKEHVKLVCARHSRRGRKQYVKKYPERVRKLPNRKIHGIVCPALICYKTYVHTSVVRVMYRREHSHPIGPENFPFTRKGRRILARRDCPAQRSGSLVLSSPSTSNGEHSSLDAPQISFPASQWIPLPSTTSSQEAVCLASSLHHIQPEDMQYYYQAHNQQNLERPSNPHPHELQKSYHGDIRRGSPNVHSPTYAYDSAPAFSPPPGTPLAHTAYARWNRLAVLFRSVHEHALLIDYPQGTLDTLENVLVNLYLGTRVMGKPLANNHEDLGFGVTRRSSVEETGVDHNEKVDYPFPMGNVCLPTPEQLAQVVFPGHIAPLEPRLC
ncbi:hypothetical protein B0J17DRAFT_773059 [Rhizoctonia solani]|nr:hypothetical protein B0J17DRAFT_773059 [Rhizoctonia solani]